MTEQKDIIFTRYLYLKDEVEIAFLLSLLNKNESALFWAFELYFSGFENDLITLIWKIYYYFYFVVNPKFETYLSKKCKKISSLSKKEKQQIISDIVNNLLLRKYTLDVFMLLQIVNNFEIEIETSDTLLSCVEKKEYEKIAVFILEKEEKIETEYFEKNGLNIKNIFKNLKKRPSLNNRHVLLAKIMHCYYLISGNKMDKKIYVETDFEDTRVYETIYNGEANEFRPYKILPMACSFGTNESNFLSVFKLQRKSSIKKDYYCHWTYYAFSCPLWKTRMEECEGFLDHVKKEIIFPNDDLHEDFYDDFSYEPDEQSVVTREKNIPTIDSDKKCKDFYEFYKKKSLSIYDVDENFLAELDKFIL